MSIDIEALRRSLLPWGFKIDDYERLSDPGENSLHQFMVWLNSGYEINEAKQAICRWLESLPDWPFLGQWVFVLRYGKGEWSFEVIKYSGGRWALHKTDAEPKWFQPAIRRWLYP